MAEVIQNRRLSVVLPVSILATFMLIVVSLAVGLAYGSHWAYVGALFFAAVLFMLLATLLEELWRRWRRDGYPPAIGLCLAALWGLVAFSCWWALELTSKDPRKQDPAVGALTYLLCTLVFVPLLCIAAYSTLGAATWVLLAAAELIFLRLYAATTFTYLFIED